MSFSICVYMKDESNESIFSFETPSVDLLKLIETELLITILGGLFECFTDRGDIRENTLYFRPFFCPLFVLSLVFAKNTNHTDLWFIMYNRNNFWPRKPENIIKAFSSLIILMVWTNCAILKYNCGNRRCSLHQYFSLATPDGIFGPSDVISRSEVLLMYPSMLVFRL